MNFFSFFEGRVDHEIRYVDQHIWHSSFSKEPFFFNKISSQLTFEAMSSQINCYLSICHLDGIILRSLPFHNLKNYLLNAKSLYSFGQSLKSAFNVNVKYIMPVTPYNDDYIHRFCTDFFANELIGYEIISGWYDTTTSSSLFEPFISRIDLDSQIICLEVDHMFRQSQMHLYHAIDFIHKFSPRNVWMPHLGCGVFLYPQLLESLYCDITLLSSVPKSLSWIDVCRNINTEAAAIAFATDSPFDSASALNTYRAYFNN